MLEAVTENAFLTCRHGGTVKIVPSQHFVVARGLKVLVEPDPIAKAIVGCPVPPTVSKPCLLTTKVDAGYSTFVRIDGHAVCMRSLSGRTDGFPLNTQHYDVIQPGQALLWVSA